MVVRMRLARFGRRNLPYYHIVVANARTARNSKPIEKVGTYNPIPDAAGNKVVNLNFDRVKYWLTVGAQPSETVEKLLEKANLIPERPKPWMQSAAKQFQQSPSTPSS
ncbi:30S ribosomal protein S16 [Dichotomocladium elegans]|nr:30S ribosomal protein S16 [Dichotomocladium elegans]